MINEKLLNKEFKSLKLLDKEQQKNLIKFIKNKCPNLLAYHKEQCKKYKISLIEIKNFKRLGLY